MAWFRCLPCGLPPPFFKLEEARSILLNEERMRNLGSLGTAHLTEKQTLGLGLYSKF